MAKVEAGKEISEEAKEYKTPETVYKETTKAVREITDYTMRSFGLYTGERYRKVSFGGGEPYDIKLGLGEKDEPIFLKGIRKDEKSGKAYYEQIVFDKEGNFQFKRYLGDEIFEESYAGNPFKLKGVEEKDVKEPELGIKRLKEVFEGKGVGIGFIK